MNVEEGEWNGGHIHPHPLLIDLILWKVLEYVRPRDLLACRGVCSKWNLFSIPLTRSKLTINLSKEFLKLPRNPNNPIKNFVEVFSQNIDGIPFGKFNLRPFSTRDGVGQQFLSLCGDTTTALRLCQKRRKDGGKKFFKVEDVSQLLISMTKLEKLRLSEELVTDSGNIVELFPGSKPNLCSFKSFTLDSDVIVNRHIDCCPTFLEELMVAAENISHISIGDRFNDTPPDSDDEIDELGDVDENEEVDKIEEVHEADEIEEDDDFEVHSNIFPALSVIENLGRESSIQSLCLGGLQMMPDVELVRRMAAKPNGLNLKKLSFSMDVEEEDGDHLHLVELFKDTLEDLSDFGSWRPNLMNFPTIPKLTRFNCNITADFNSRLVNFNKIFPVLKNLELYQQRDGQVHDEFFPQCEPCPTVESLKLRGFIHLTINAFNHVLTIFPRLTELKIAVKVDGPEILRQIWTQMSQLESLTIYGRLQTTESIDALFTGISTDSIQEFTGILNDLDKITVECRRDTIQNLKNQQGQLPSIGNLLTNLKSLELDVSGRGDQTQSLNNLSDVSGFLGFYGLKHLTHLVVRNCELTKTCCELLTMEMAVGLESWAFTTPEGKAIIPDHTY